VKKKMAEYDSFHYLMHKVEEGPAAHFLGASKTLSFNEIYSPRDGIRMCGTEEKFYFRTRDRIKFTFYELRKEMLYIVTCLNVELKPPEPQRTILLNLEELYNVVEAKAADRKDNEGLFKKSDRAFADDKTLDAAVVKYLAVRMISKKEAQLWPGYEIPSIGDNTSTKAETNNDATDGSGKIATIDTSTSAPISDTSVAMADNTIGIDAVSMKITATNDQMNSNNKSSTVVSPTPLPTLNQTPFYTERMITFEKSAGDSNDSNITEYMTKDLPLRLQKLDLIALGIDKNELKLTPSVAPQENVLTSVTKTDNDTNGGHEEGEKDKDNDKEKEKEKENDKEKEKTDEIKTVKKSNTSTATAVKDKEQDKAKGKTKVKTSVGAAATVTRGPTKGKVSRKVAPSG
jgi:hypothetical protein